jgi:hypothetical protein
MAAPSRPTGLTAIQTGTTAVVALSWTDNSSNETGFKIQRKEDRAASWTTIYTAAADATSYNDSTVTLGKFYQYQILATNGDGDSESSGVVEIIPTKVGSFSHVKARLMAMLPLATAALSPEATHVSGNLNMSPLNVQNMPVATVRIIPMETPVVYGRRTPSNVAGKMFEVDFTIYVYAKKDESGHNEYAMSQAIADLIIDYLDANALGQSDYKIHNIYDLRSREADIGSSNIRRVIVEGTMLTSRADA